MATDVMSKDFTRTLFDISATAKVVDSIDFSTMTIVAHDVSVEFVSTIKDDIKLATAMLKDLDSNVNIESVTITSCKATVYAMSLGDFVKHARKVERGANGRVKELDA